MTRTPLTNDGVLARIDEILDPSEYDGKRVLLVVPDATRTAPLPLLFATLADRLLPVVAKLDVIVALGTHPAMSDEAIARLLGVSPDERSTRFSDVGFFNHEWDRPDRLLNVGTLSVADVEAISEGLLSEEVPVEVNSRVADYDTLLVCGPVFPHEVVGYSGGNKYFFPGLSGPRLLNFFHWLGALITNVGIIGLKHTPVRAVVDRAARMIPTERRCLAFVVDSQARPYDLFYDTPEDAWDQAADVSADVHVKWMPRPYDTVLSCAPPMYDDVWVAGKCMYKLEPVVADGGELIIYAPHVTEVSVTHGEVIEQVGYHVRDYFTKQWDRFADVPRGVLAHSTHVRGAGTFEDGIEKPRVQVTLATRIPREVCERINLGYRDPDSIDVESFANREDEGVLLVRKAGEHLHRLASERE